VKVGPSGFCIPVSNGCTVLRREGRFQKVPQPFRLPMSRRGLTRVLPEARAKVHGSFRMLIRAAALRPAGRFRYKFLFFGNLGVGRVDRAMPQLCGLLRFS